MHGPRIFSSHLDRTERRVYGAVIAFFCLVFAAMLWPLYTLFAGARPLIAGLPLSLFFLAVLLVLSFSVLLGLYLWESRRGRLDTDRDG